jgi:hypothetical protein
MQCPRCVQRIHRGAEVCPHCGFSLALADQGFVGLERKTATLADAVGLLRMKDRLMVQKCMQKFSQRFPQFFFALNIGSFAHKTDLRQYGFWVLNRAVFSDLPPQLSNAAAILLVMDADHKLAGMSFGYALDAFLDEEDTMACLQKAQSLWMEHQYAEGIIAVIKHLEAILIRRHRMQKKNLQPFAQKVSPPNKVVAVARPTLRNTDLRQNSEEDRL